MGIVVDAATGQCPIISASFDLNGGGGSSVGRFRLAKADSRQASRVRLASSVKASAPLGSFDGGPFLNDPGRTRFRARVRLTELRAPARASHAWVRLTDLHRRLPTEYSCITVFTRWTFIDSSFF